MTHTTIAGIRTLTLSAVMALAPSLHAADPVKVPWTDLCKAANGRELTIVTTSGDTVTGYCMSINVDEVAVNSTDKRVVKIARAALSKIHMRQQADHGHQLKALGRGMRKGIWQGSDWLLSPYAPLGMVTVPATLAWGAVAAPFCLLSDLIHGGDAGTQEIKVL